MRCGARASRLSIPVLAPAASRHHHARSTRTGARGTRRTWTHIVAQDSEALATNAHSTARRLWFRPRRANGLVRDEPGGLRVRACPQCAARRRDQRRTPAGRGGGVLDRQARPPLQGHSRIVARTTPPSPASKSPRCSFRRSCPDGHPEGKPRPVLLFWAGRASRGAGGHAPASRQAIRRQVCSSMTGARGEQLKAPRGASCPVPEFDGH